MKIRHSTGSGADKVEMNMTPMIDVVFQLLSFFMFTLKIATVEGNFNIQMIAADRRLEGTPNEQQSLKVKLHLSANADGSLSQIELGEACLPSMDALHTQIKSRFLELNQQDAAVRGPGEEGEVEISFDRNLKYLHVMDAVTKVSGFRDPEGHVVKMFQKIKFVKRAEGPAP